MNLLPPSSAEAKHGDSRILRNVFCLTLKIEAAAFSETLIFTYKTMQYHDQEGSNLMFHHLPWKSSLPCLHSWVVCLQALFSVEACVHGSWVVNCVHHFGYLISARPKKSTEASGGMSVSAITSPERVGRTRSRVAGVSQSQRKLCIVVDVSCQQPGLNMLCM